MRLIDADELTRKVTSWLRPVTDEMNMVDADNVTVSVIMEIEEAPTIDLVKHSRWVKMTGMMPPEYMGRHCCLECSALAPHDFGRERLTDWCPACGSKMDLSTMYQAEIGTMG